MRREPAFAVAAAMCALSLAEVRAQERGCELRVVDSATQEPVAGAEVRWGISPAACEPLGWTWTVIEQADLACLGELLDSGEGGATTDGSGRVRVPLGAWPTTIVARRGGDIGWLERSRSGVEHQAGPAGEPLLMLAADGDVLVRAVDADGAAVQGLDVQLECGAFAFDTENGATDSDGRARLRHAAALARARVNERRFVDQPAPLVRVLAPLFDDCERVLDPDELPWPATLAVPAHGWIEVAPLGLDGGAVAVELPFAVACVTSVGELEDQQVDPATAQEFLGFGAGISRRADVAHGRMRVAVPLGKRFYVAAARNELSRASSVAIAGPAHAGEVVRAVVPLGSVAGTLHARIVDRNGLPVCSAVFDVLLESTAPRALVDGEQRPRRRRVTSDAAGCVDLDVDPEWGAFIRGWHGRPLAPPAEELLLAFLCTNTEGRSLAARRTWKPEKEPRRFDLGDLALAPTPLVAAGRVFDSLGKPIAGARVATYTGSEEESFALTDSKGRFQLFDPRFLERLSIRVDAADFEFRLADLRAGADALNLQLKRAK